MEEEEGWLSEPPEEGVVGTTLITVLPETSSTHLEGGSD